MAKDYYVILGVSENASLEDIRAAFRRRALELHPDRSGMESGPFQALQEAYSVLGDPERRRRYDRERGRASRGRSPAGRAAEPLRPPRPKGEPLRPAEPLSGFREVSLTDSFQTDRPGFQELFDRFWRSL